jgi:hypothetical protein
MESINLDTLFLGAHMESVNLIESTPLDINFILWSSYVDYQSDRVHSTRNTVFLEYHMESINLIYCSPLHWIHCNLRSSK